MPIDASIPLSARGAQIQSPFEALGQLAELQEMRERSETRRLAAEEARTRTQRQRRIEDVYTRAITVDPATQQPTIDYELLLGESGLPGDLRPAVLVQMQEDAQRALDLQSKTLTAEEKKTNYLGSAARTVIAAQGNPLIWGVELLAAKKLGVIDDQQHNALARLQDPQQILGLAQSYVARAGGETAKPQLVTHVPTSGPFAGQPVQEFVPPVAGARYVKPPEASAGVSWQDTSVLLDGRPATVFFNPKERQYVNAAGEDVTARVRPMPPASPLQLVSVVGPDGKPVLVPESQAVGKTPGSAASSSGDWTPKQVQTFNQIAGAYERSPLIRAADRTNVLKDAITAAKADPKNATNQLNLAYAYIAALDTYQSAVREGELQNLGLLGTRLQQLGVTVDRYVTSGAFIPPAVASQIATSAEQLAKTIEAGQRQKQREFGSRAKVSGVGEMWDQFVAGFQAPPENGGGTVPPEGTRQPIPGVPGGEAEYRGGRWIRVK